MYITNKFLSKGYIYIYTHLCLSSDNFTTFSVNKYTEKPMIFSFYSAFWEFLGCKIKFTGTILAVRAL